MKKYKINVPVRINIWIREECLKKQFMVIKKVRPKVLFLISDGGRTDDEKEIIRKNRNFIEKNIDWECTIYKLFEDENQGMYEMAMKSHKLVWSKVDRCILLEDDILPSESFFTFASILLERYKDDKRINLICGMNHLGIYENPDSDYFFSKQGSIWGIATWRRVYEDFYDLSYRDSTYIYQLLGIETKHDRWFWKHIKAYYCDDLYEGHVPGSEFYFELGVFAQNQLQIIPKKNLISNIGSTHDSTNADELDCLPKGIRRVFNMETYDLSFPIKHPKYVIPDSIYAKRLKKIMGFGHPLVNASRKMNRILLLLKHKKYKKIINKLHNKYNNRR